MAFDIGKRIQYLLDAKDKTQTDLARYLGLKSAAVSQWISGKAHI